MTPFSTTRLWLLRTAALSLSVLVALAGVEVLLRATGQDHPLCWQPDPRVGWWHIPGAELHWTEEGDGRVRINRLGMRDVERTREKPAGVFRIAVFGDSMTEGVQVNLDQTYTQQLEARLRGRGLNVEVLNFGVNGYSPLEGYLLYDAVGKAFHPDLVLHAVFLDNDIADGDPDLAAGQVGAPFVLPGDGPLSIDYSRVQTSYRDYHREPVHTIRQWSALYRWLSWWRNGLRGQARARAGQLEEQGIPKRFMLYADPAGEEWDAAWKTYERIFEAFQSDVQSAGSRFALISVPAGQVVNAQAWQTVLAQNPAMQRLAWALDGPETRLEGIARTHAVDLLQPLNRFREAAGGPPLFFNGIGHMTPRGHAVMAGFLEQELLARGLVPAPASRRP